MCTVVSYEAAPDEDVQGQQKGRRVKFLPLVGLGCPKQAFAKIATLSYSFAEVTELEIVCHEWSDGPSTYKIRLTPCAGKPFVFGDFSSRIDTKSALSSLGTMVTNK